MLKKVLRLAVFAGLALTMVPVMNADAGAADYHVTVANEGGGLTFCMTDTGRWDLAVKVGSSGTTYYVESTEVDNGQLIAVVPDDARGRVKDKSFSADGSPAAPKSIMTAHIRPGDKKSDVFIVHRDGAGQKHVLRLREDAVWADGGCPV